MFVLREKGSAWRIFGADPVKDGLLTLKDPVKAGNRWENTVRQTCVQTYALFTHPGCARVLMCSRNHHHI